MSNYYYRTAIEEYNKAKKTFLIVSLVLIPAFLIVTFILVVNHPEYVDELLENGGKH